MTDAYLFEQIAEALRLQIARGELQTGDRLPSIREMADTWNCTPGTVNRAYAILADEGLVTSRRGSGTVVTRVHFASGGKPLRSALLVNQLEASLLNLVGQGYSLSEVEFAFTTAVKRWHTWQQKSFDKAVGAGRQLRFVGSHDLALERLVELLAERSSYELKTTYRGSLGGLMALARGEADLAGSHLWDEKTDSYNIPFVQRVLPGERVALLTIAGRSFGLLLPPGNPQRVADLGDLVKPGLRWVNRQPGSGTRVWLDAQLKKLDVNTNEIEGFGNVKTTHNEVAEAIIEGQATAGLGIQAAARAYALDFVSLAQEQYQLAIPERAFETTACQKLIGVLQSKQFAAVFQDLGGYDTTVTGNLHWVE